MRHNIFPKVLQLGANKANKPLLIFPAYMFVERGK